MAKKRMISIDVVDTDAFLELPLSAQALYLWLNLKADDDGFVGNPKRIKAYIGASDDDLRLLILKRFLIVFDDGVVVIKHWRMHNTIQKDRYSPTKYQEDLKMLGIKPNKSYTLPAVNSLETKCFQNVSTDLDIGLDIDSDLDIGSDLDIEIDTITPNGVICQSKSTDVDEIVSAWNELSAFGIKPISKLSQSKRKDNLIARIRQYGKESVLAAIKKVSESDFLQGKNDRGWTITFDWFVLPSNFPKVLEGNYDNRGSVVSKKSGGIDWDAL